MRISSIASSGHVAGGFSLAVFDGALGAGWRTGQHESRAEHGK